ncbi:transmembrane protein 130-like [Tetranychus urticae]|uniref:transmembrane protein 130-like n=1 Tax=Tetranychus urticae TaxID=32264 RepID=UPI00077BBD36|nr:transmembrane protein 130-like [Tetranychus urticae]
MRSLSSFFILCIVLSSNGISCDAAVTWYDWGPGTIGVPMQIRVASDSGTRGPSYEFRFKFDQFPQYDKTIVSDRSYVDYVVTFEPAKAGNYTMQIDVWNCYHGVPFDWLGTLNSTFQLLDSLTGTIAVNDDENKKVVSTAEAYELTARMSYHSWSFEATNITYKWIINDEVQEESYKVIQHTFSQPQLNNISVIVTATKTNGSDLIQKSGSFSTTLESKDPITNFTVDGPTEVKVFERLQLDCKIHGGTPPFQCEYFFWIDNPYSEHIKVTKHSNESSSSLIRYFSAKGTRTLRIIAKNDVSSITKSMEISVY